MEEMEHDDATTPMLAPMAPMRIRHDSVQSNTNTFVGANQAASFLLPDASDTQVDGVDVAPHLPGDANEPASEYDQALNRFMRNEVDYDEFMRLTGGMSLNEEGMAAGDDNNTSRTAADGEEEEDDDGDDGEGDGDDASDGEEGDLDLTNVSSTSSATPQNPPPAKQPRTLRKALEAELPPAALTIMREMVDDDGLGKADPMMMLPPAIGSTNLSAIAAASALLDSGEPSSSSAPARAPNERSRKLNRTLDALLGQANLIYAKGQTREALDMLLEVIRQEPRNAEPYRQVAEIYHELGQPHRSLQYGLLAAHLDGQTPAGEWCELGDASHKLERLEEAAACYGRAIRLEPTNWSHYERRIAMLEARGLRQQAMRTRLQAAQMVDLRTCHAADFTWFEQLIKTVAEYYIMMNDEEKAIFALEAFVLRSRQFGRVALIQHDTLINMWMTKSKHADALKSILALCDGITAVRSDGSTIEATFTHGEYNVDPFPPPSDTKITVTDEFCPYLLARVIICLINIGKKELVSAPLAQLTERNLADPNLEHYVVEIAKAYLSVDAYSSTKKFVERLNHWTNLNVNPDMQFIYANALIHLKDSAAAMAALERTLELQPTHVDARIQLSTLQQRAGMADLALATLHDHDLDACTRLPDERLLVRQAEALFEHKRTEQFVRCARMLLTPYFYALHANGDVMSKRRIGRNSAVWSLSNTLRQAALQAIQNSVLEKFVKRLGVAAAAEQRVLALDVHTLHDYCLKLIESLLSMGRYQDMLCVCCYAFLQPMIAKNDRTTTFQSLLYFCAIKAQSWPLAFEYVRWYHQTTLGSHPILMPNDREVLYKRIFNAMNFVFCHSQNVSYHRYVMRALSKCPGNHALQAISGNNSLITGTYRHALGEYLRVWSENKTNPLVCLLLGLTFTHMACKKDLSSRHMIALRGLAFMKMYERTRSVRQETMYNMARMFHQMSITPLAIHFYNKTLAESPPRVSTVDEEGQERIEHAYRYDMRRFAAHNLALLYASSGNEHLARQIYEKYLVVE